VFAFVPCFCFSALAMDSESQMTLICPFLSHRTRLISLFVAWALVRPPPVQILLMVLETDLGALPFGTGLFLAALLFLLPWFVGAHAVSTRSFGFFFFCAVVSPLPPPPGGRVNPFRRSTQPHPSPHRVPNSGPRFMSTPLFSPPSSEGCLQNNQLRAV